jgi:hypothetical protein
MKHANKAAYAFLAAIAIALSLAACGNSSDETNEATTTGATTRPADHPESASMGGKVPTIVIRNGEPVGGIKQLEYSAGEEIRFEVSSDVADEVHVHGYDLMQDVPAGGTVSFDFPAEIEGIFEAELEGRKEQIAEIRVNP